MTQKVSFIVTERKCNTNSTGKEFALFCKFDTNPRWNICSWNKKPKDTEVQFAKDLFIRSCEIYHKHIKFPRYNMEEISEVIWTKS